MDFNHTRLTKQKTMVRLLCSALITLLDISFPIECPLFLRSLSRVSFSHLAGHLFQASLPVVESLSDSLSHLACHLFQSSLPVVKSLRGPLSHLTCHLSQSSKSHADVTSYLKTHSTPPNSGTCSMLLI